jgi:hypothetical protein
MFAVSDRNRSTPEHQTFPARAARIRSAAQWREEKAKQLRAEAAANPRTATAKNKRATRLEIEARHRRAEADFVQRRWEDFEAGRQRGHAERMGVA